MSEISGRNTHGYEHIIRYVIIIKHNLNSLKYTMIDRKGFWPYISELYLLLYKVKHLQGIHIYVDNVNYVLLLIWHWCTPWENLIKISKVKSNNDNIVCIADRKQWKMKTKGPNYILRYLLVSVLWDKTCFFVSSYAWETFFNESNCIAKWKDDGI